MNHRSFERLVAVLAIGFTLFFAVVVIGGFLDDPQLLDAIGDGFVNPFAAGYSTDVVTCALILGLWIIHERRTSEIKGGYWCIVLSFVPGVAVGFGVYLIIRARQLRSRPSAESPVPTTVG